MQNSETCMFCRYRKARIAACCAARSAPPAQGEGAGQAPSSVAPAASEAAFPQQARRETPQFA
ncbi:hypothetical protein [Massilia sp. 9096]|uniref:hypothetical protein n=1 Tax=Massilia sp. 9096 TaxID=1500894 RepID=UPI000ABDA771|nr:hypothetical protein [Massilia sp. 9096]